MGDASLPSPRIYAHGHNGLLAVHFVVYRLPAIDAISFYWIRMKVLQQLTCVTLGLFDRPVSC